MNDPEMSSSQIETLRSFNNAGIVTLYALQAAMESIVLRVVSSNGEEPKDGEKYIVEFRHPATGEILEILEEEYSRLFSSKTIRNVMDELAESYLRAVAEDWEVYVAQSGRCSPDESAGSPAKGDGVLRTIIRDNSP